MLVTTSNLSAYELERLSNVERNNEHLRSLGLEPLSKQLKPAPSTPQKKPREHKTYGDAPKRKSPRVQEAPGKPLYDEDAMYRKMLKEAGPLRRPRRTKSEMKGSDDESDDEDGIFGGSDGGGSGDSGSEYDSRDDDDDDDDPLGLRDEYEPSDDGDEVPEYVKNLRDKAEVLDVINLPDYGDLRLHKSLRSSTGYKNVVYMPTCQVAKPYACFSVRDPTTSQKRVLGCYRTAVEAAVVFAKYIKHLHQLENPDSSEMACEEVATEAEGMELHTSHRSVTGYEGVRKWKSPSGRPVERVRYRAVAPMRDTKRAGQCLGYYETAVEAAVAFAKYVRDPQEWEEWRDAKRLANPPPKRITFRKESTSTDGGTPKTKKSKEKKEKEPGAKPGTKGCPICNVRCGVRTRECEYCGHQFSVKPTKKMVREQGEEEEEEGEEEEVSPPPVVAASSSSSQPGGKWNGRMREKRKTSYADEAPLLLTAPPPPAAAPSPAKKPRGRPPGSKNKVPMASASAPAPKAAAATATTDSSANPWEKPRERAWVGACYKTVGCVCAAGHSGPCKLGAFGQEDYEVEEVLDERDSAIGHAEYLVKWKGWPIEDCTWEPTDSLRNCPRILKAWNVVYKQRMAEKLAKEQQTEAAGE